jgi:hypothetical protein
MSASMDRNAKIDYLLKCDFLNLTCSKKSSIYAAMKYYNPGHFYTKHENDPFAFRLFNLICFEYDSINKR